MKLSLLLLLPVSVATTAAYLMPREPEPLPNDALLPREAEADAEAMPAPNLLVTRQQSCQVSGQAGGLNVRPSCRIESPCSSVADVRLRAGALVGPRQIALGFRSQGFVPVRQ